MVVLPLLFQFKQPLCRYCSKAFEPVLCRAPGDTGCPTCSCRHIFRTLMIYTTFSIFTVQAAVMPVLLQGVRTGFVSGTGGYRPPDICCSAPTGSGKTLAFVLPIVQVCLMAILATFMIIFVLKKHFLNLVGKHVIMMIDLCHFNIWRSIYVTNE